MTRENKPYVILIFILIGLFLCCCLASGAAVFTLLRSSGQKSTLSLPGNQTKATPEVTNLPSAEDPATDASMDQIESEVSKLRGLALNSTLKRVFLTPQQLEEKVTSDFFKDYTDEDAAQDVGTLSLLGLLPEDFDITEYYKQLYAEQIAGFYDDQTQAMFVVAGQKFGGMERTTYAHEFTHALQDAAYHFEDGLGYSEEKCKGNSEACAAVQALIEGDATKTQLSWTTQYATPQDMKDMQEFYSTFKTPVMDSGPAYMVEDLSFPYLQGAAFVNALATQGGQEAINKAFTRELPVSTEQIMHPAKYPAEKPEIVTLPDLVSRLGGNWKELDRETVGEWYTWLILARGYEENIRQIDNVASMAAEGWGGDQYAYLSDGKNHAIAITWRWDSEKDAQEAYKAFQTYSRMRFGKADANGIAALNNYYSALLFNADNSLSWVVSTDRETTTSLSTLLAGN